MCYTLDIVAHGACLAVQVSLFVEHGVYEVQIAFTELVVDPPAFEDSWYSRCYLREFLSMQSMTEVVQTTFGPLARLCRLSV